MKFKNPTPYDILMLATKRDENVYRVTHNTARAVIEIHGDEIRIPFVARVVPGDFEALMDRLVDELDHQRVRFVGTGGDSDEYSQIMDLLSPDNARSIKEAVNGFETEILHDEYTNADGDVQPVETLVGDWTPEERP